jgi:hypothetical protein
VNRRKAAKACHRPAARIKGEWKIHKSNQYRRIVKREVNIIPAAGWSVAAPLTDSSGRINRLHDEPAIGWRVDVCERDDGSVFVQQPSPLVADPWCDPDECLWRRPDGRLFSIGGPEFASDEEAIDYLRELQDEAVRNPPAANE